MAAPRRSSRTVGAAYSSEAFEAVCDRLEMHHEPIMRTPGDSYNNLLETHGNVQRRFYDSQFSWTQTPAACEPVHQALRHPYNTTAPQGVLQEDFDPPIPLRVLGEAKGSMDTPDA
jgi:hypothetical protein